MGKSKILKEFGFKQEIIDEVDKIEVLNFEGSNSIEEFQQVISSEISDGLIFHHLNEDASLELKMSL